MKLLTEELRKQLPPLYSQEYEVDPLVICKFFHPLSFWTWYANEGSPVDENGYYDTDQEKVDFLFFGWVYGDFPELGYFSLSELESVNVMGLGIERDLHFTPTRLSEVKKQHEQTPERVTPVIIYLIEEDEPDFTPVIVLAQRMARLLLAMNYRRPTWITNLDENRTLDSATSAFGRIVEHIKPLFDISFLEMAKEVFVAAFISQIAESLADYLLKWYEWQRTQPSQEEGNS